MITKKTPEEIEILKQAGSLLAKLLKELAKEAIHGNTTLDLDDRAMELCEEWGVEPVLLGYHPSFADYRLRSVCRSMIVYSTGFRVRMWY